VEVRSLACPKTTSGSTGRFGASTSRTGLTGINLSFTATSMIRNKIERHAITVSCPTADASLLATAEKGRLLLDSLAESFKEHLELLS
jgi:hypothetical protein